MKEGWEIKKLGEVCKITPTKSEIKKKNIKLDKPISFLPMEDLGINSMFITPSKQKTLNDALSGYTYFAENDLLLAKVTPCFENGKLGIANNLEQGIGFGSSEYIVVRTDSTILLKEWVYYIFQSSNFKSEGIKLMKGASGLKRLPKEYVINYSIPIPPLAEQKRIVSILDKAFAAIDKAKANAEKSLSNAKELFESYLNRVFENNDDWEEKTLKELTVKIGSGATPRGGQQNYKTTGVSLVRSMNIHDCEFRKKNLAFIDEKQAKELDGVTLQEEDVLLNITGASVARCSVLPKEFLPARVNQHVSIIRPKKEMINAHFLNYLLVSKPYKDQLLLTGEQGATRQAITKSQIESFKISFPKIEKQQEITTKIQGLRKEAQALESNYSKKILSLAELKKSILQKAFNGEI